MKKISKNELKDILALHKVWLESGGTKGAKADLYRACLCGADLEEAGLDRSDLRGAELGWACLCGVDLSGINLRGAILYRADLSKALLRGANLEGADLRWACLCGADLEEAGLDRSDLRGADLSGTILRGASLRGAYLSGADLRGADLYRANLIRANLSWADLRRAYLCGADLTGAQISSAVLGQATLDKHYYTIDRIGSRKDATTYCVEDDRVFCGCWKDYKGGTLADFAARVKDIYGPEGATPNAQYYAEYMAAIAFFKALKEEGKNENQPKG